MPLRRFRALQDRRTPARFLATGLLLTLAAACGRRDGATVDVGTGPGAFPSVVGTFQRIDVIAALTCTPQNPPSGGDIAFEAYTLNEPVKIAQSGSKLSLSRPNQPAEPADTGSIDMAGKATLGFKLSFKEKNLRSGARQFYVDVTGTFVLDRSADGTKLTGTGSYVNVLHEASATAPVFATCTRSSTIDMTRTGT